MITDRSAPAEDMGFLQMLQRTLPPRPASLATGRVPGASGDKYRAALDKILEKYGSMEVFAQAAAAELPPELQRPQDAAPAQAMAAPAAARAESAARYGENFRPYSDAPPAAAPQPYSPNFRPYSDAPPFEDDPSFEVSARPAPMGLPPMGAARAAGAAGLQSGAVNDLNHIMMSPQSSGEQRIEAALGKARMNQGAPGGSWVPPHALPPSANQPVPMSPMAGAAGPPPMQSMGMPQGTPPGAGDLTPPPVDLAQAALQSDPGEALAAGAKQADAITEPPAALGGAGTGSPDGGKPWDQRFLETVRQMTAASGEDEGPSADDRGLALARLGFGMAASKSPHFGQALGEGGMGAVDQLQKMRAQRAEQRMRAMSQNLSIAGTAASLGMQGDAAKRQQSQFDQTLEVQKAAAATDPKDKEITRMMRDLGIPREQATALAYDVIVPNRDPLSGRVDLVNKLDAFGPRGGAPGAQPAPGAAPPSAPTDDPLLRAPLLSMVDRLGGKAVAQEAIGKMSLGTMDPGPEVNIPRQRLKMFNAAVIDMKGGSKMSNQDRERVETTLPSQGIFESAERGYDVLNTYRAEAIDTVKSQTAVAKDPNMPVELRKEALEKIAGARKVIDMVGDPAEIPRPGAKGAAAKVGGVQPPANAKQAPDGNYYIETAPGQFSKWTPD